MRTALLLLCMALLWLGALLAVLTWPLRVAGAVLWRWQRGSSTWFDRERAVLRLLDHLTGLAWFGSDWWESLSANSARVRRTWLTRALDVVEPGHCEQALRRELDVIDFFNRREKGNG